MKRRTLRSSGNCGKKSASRRGDAERLMYYAAVYPGRTIWLDVWVIKDWSGQPRGLDAQSLEWVEPARLREHDILEADAPIVAALSRRYVTCSLRLVAASGRSGARKSG